MTPHTWHALTTRLSDRFRRCRRPSQRQVQWLTRRAPFSLPTDYFRFVRRFGYAHIGGYPVYGIGRCSAMGFGGTHVLNVTRRFHSQAWPGTEAWLVISVDMSGNPIGLSGNGAIWLSDHDEGVIQPLAPSFEGLLTRTCLRTT